ncbi:hypothetical protein CQY20_26175 [Mycolicibacterium agri]|uniref:Uncharacterized protein n=1 Tax=Mycolicibacterium agri TaxID=36811 RepID=A0A2A7MRX2_MYCAG|nr:hypothetical protein [Mycolicibacterium agri]PEG34300.1 hypothetical protein CQY20_26175 [Mycolicibacterium agri]GFG51359.1 hypothetical protein MAGR_28000 [Mycolicibacterium agri]
MGERPSTSDEPVSEAIATTGLILNIASAIALVICLAAFSAEQVGLALIAGVGAAFTFTASLICFSKQAAEAEAPVAAQAANA